MSLPNQNPALPSSAAEAAALLARTAVASRAVGGFCKQAAVPPELQRALLAAGIGAAGGGALGLAAGATGKRRRPLRGLLQGAVAGAGLGGGLAGAAQLLPKLSPVWRDLQQQAASQAARRSAVTDLNEALGGPGVSQLSDLPAVPPGAAPAGWLRYLANTVRDSGPVGAGVAGVAAGTAGAAKSHYDAVVALGRAARAGLQDPPKGAKTIVDAAVAKGGESAFNKYTAMLNAVLHREPLGRERLAPEYAVGRRVQKLMTGDSARRDALSLLLREPGVTLAGSRFRATAPRGFVLGARRLPGAVPTALAMLAARGLYNAATAS